MYIQELEKLIDGKRESLVFSNKVSRDTLIEELFSIFFSLGHIPKGEFINDNPSYLVYDLHSEESSIRVVEFSDKLILMRL